MKRTISFLSSGSKSDGSKYYMVVFACELVNDVLYNECRIFVPENIYGALEIGQSLTVK